MNKEKNENLKIKRVLEKYDWEERGNKQYVVRTFLVTLEVRDIINRIKDDSWVVPTLQRENKAWNVKQKSDLIDSILKGYPIPGMMIVTAGNKQYLLDGQQRITTLIDFCSNKFKLKLDNSGTNYNGKKFSELSDDEQRTIRSTVIGIQNVTSTSPANDNSFMYEIFARINSGGTSLTRQEVRNAINASQAMEEIKNYANKIFDSNYRSIFPNNKNPNEIISWMFRISYFAWRGNLIESIDDFSHLYNKKNIALDYLLDHYTSYYFKNYDGSSEKLIRTIKNFILEIEENNLFSEWVMSFDTNLRRTNKAQPTFIDCLSIYYGINGNLRKFKNQREIFLNFELKNNNNENAFEKYKEYFQQQTLLTKSIIKRYRLLFREI